MLQTNTEPLEPSSERAAYGSPCVETIDLTPGLRPHLPRRASETLLWVLEADG